MGRITLLSWTRSRYLKSTLAALREKRGARNTCGPAPRALTPRNEILVAPLGGVSYSVGGAAAPPTWAAATPTSWLATLIFD